VYAPLPLHHALNDVTVRGFASASFPVTKEPTGVFRSDGIRPDGLTFVLWQSGRVLCWDVTVICPLDEPYVSGAQPPVRLVQQQSLPLHTRERNMLTQKVATFSNPLQLRLLAVSARQLMSLLGRRIAQVSGEARESSFLFQRCSALVQRFNAVLLHDSLTVIDCTD